MYSGWRKLRIYSTKLIRSQPRTWSPIIVKWRDEIFRVVIIGSQQWLMKWIVAVPKILLRHDLNDRTWILFFNVVRKTILWFLSVSPLHTYTLESFYHNIQSLQSKRVWCNVFFSVDWIPSINSAIWPLE